MGLRHWCAVLATGIAPVLACGTAGSTGFDPVTGDASANSCTPNTPMACHCADGKEGSQFCNADGTLSTCQPCGLTAGDAGTSNPACGDSTCSNGETCDTCPEDCGLCPRCATAPACEGMQVPPQVVERFATYDIQLKELNKRDVLLQLKEQVLLADPTMRITAAALSPAEDGEPAKVTETRNSLQRAPLLMETMRAQLARAGMPSTEAYRLAHPPLKQDRTMGGEFDPKCGPPLLRIRIEKLSVQDTRNATGADDIYCKVMAESPAGDEIQLTPKQSAGAGETRPYALDEGLVWGHKELRAPNGSIVLTYNCIRAVNNEGYANVLKTLGEAASEEDGNPFGYGWVFGVAGIAAKVAAAAVVLAGDELLLTAQQIVYEKDQPQIMFGGNPQKIHAVRWTVHGKGGGLGNGWDWTLHMQAWGCAKYGGMKQ